jgi:ATP-dependent Lon protease
MNPIIYIDELDKISNTEHGREIIGILIHLTDPSQNEDFNDRYFSGIPIDLSKCLIIFSYNDASKVDRILLDRIHRIYTKALSSHDKIQIIIDYVMPELLNTVGFNENDIKLSEECILHIIQTYTSEAGVRKLKEHILQIIREINVQLINGSILSLPYKVTVKKIDEWFDKSHKFVHKTINDKPRIGLVNGLYASVSSMGGITLIQTYKCYSDKFYNIQITGQQGDVMKESISVSHTVAWNLLTKKKQKEIIKNNEFLGIHLHCPETSTPKDGPSAGGAITTSILSLLLQTPVTNTCAMTGEIDLHGNIMRIGGLSAKLCGARMAGVKKVLVPKSNESDFEKIKKYEKDFVLDDSFEVIIVETIYDVLPHMMPKLDKKTILTKSQFFSL